MKRILLILVGIVFLQAPANMCLGDTPETYGQERPAGRNADNVRSNKEMTDEEETERIFYDFITKDVARKGKKRGNVFYYAEFPNANQAYNAILNFIVSRTNKKQIFADTKRYETELIAVKWKENSADKTVVKGGFARVDATFKEKTEKYTVIFCNK